MFIGSLTSPCWSLSVKSSSSTSCASSSSRSLRTFLRDVVTWIDALKAEHFNPFFMQPHAPRYPFLHLQDISYRSFCGAAGFKCLNYSWAKFSTTIHTDSQNILLFFLLFPSKCSANGRNALIFLLNQQEIRLQKSNITVKIYIVFYLIFTLW